MFDLYRLRIGFFDRVCTTKAIDFVLSTRYYERSLREGYYWSVVAMLDGRLEADVAEKFNAK